jgi:uncharacterized protein YndB with AHSA1/START domain
MSVYTDGLDLVFERTFDAPRELVWKTFLDPELIPRWWGPHGYTTTVVEMDVRPGGQWRFITHTTGGEDVPFHGEYLEIDPPHGFKQTFIVDIDGLRDKPGIETFRFEEVDGRTKLTARSLFPTIDDLEAAVATGMIHGAVETWDRFETLLAER